MENGKRLLLIPADKSRTGGFIDLYEEIEDVDANDNRQVVGRRRGA